MAHPSLQKVTQLMEGALEHLRREFSTLRTGRASVALIDHITVDYYGTPTPLKQIANLSVPESRLLHIQPWDPSSIKDIEKALTTSELGVTPSNDGKVIRLPIPPLSEERRKELVKVCKKYAEETKIQIRGFRREGNEELKGLQKSGEISEDDLRRDEADNQKLTDASIHKVDDLLKKKEEEILEI